MTTINLHTTTPADIIATMKNADPMLHDAMALGLVLEVQATTDLHSWVTWTNFPATASAAEQRATSPPTAPNYAQPTAKPNTKTASPHAGSDSRTG